MLDLKVFLKRERQKTAGAMEFPAAQNLRELAPWQGILLAGKEGTVCGAERRMGDRGWLGSNGETRTLKGEGGLLLGPEGKGQGSRAGWGRRLSNRKISPSETGEGKKSLDCCSFFSYHSLSTEL